MAGWLAGLWCLENRRAAVLRGGAREKRTVFGSVRGGVPMLRSMWSKRGGNLGRFALVAVMLESRTQVRDVGRLVPPAQTRPWI